MENLFKISWKELGLYIGNRIMEESGKWTSTDIEDYRDLLSNNYGEIEEIDGKQLSKNYIESHDKNNLVYDIEFYEEIIEYDNGTCDINYYIEKYYKKYLKDDYEEKFLKKTEDDEEIEETEIEELYYSTYGKLIQLMDKLKEEDIEKSKKIQKILDEYKEIEL